MNELYETKYHKTGQYRNAIKHLVETLTFGGLDKEGKAIKVPLKKKVVAYCGTVKLHGTNANIVLHWDGKITFHSKEKLLATLHPDDSFDLYKDNAEFGQSMFRRREGVRKLFDMYDLLREEHFPIKFSGEWAGPGIQKGVGISGIDKKSLFIFNVKFNESNKCPLFVVGLNEYGIYNISEFPTYKVNVNLSIPEDCTHEIGVLVDEVEGKCPVASKLGVEGDLIGEGIVWTPVDSTLYSDTGTWFKTKGHKHSVSKVKKLISMDPEKVASIQEFVSYAVTQNRLNQGLENVELDIKNTGKFIGWVSRDINKEEGDVLEASNLTMKDVGKYISTATREFFISKC